MKEERVVFISQSNYIPWKGYFDAIANADIWVVFDEMQYTKRDWRNRNLIKTESGPKWLTIPVNVKGRFLQKIRDTEVSDMHWVDNHLNQMREWYKKASCFKEVFPIIVGIYRSIDTAKLSELNVQIIRGILDYLNIKTEIINDYKFELKEDKTHRLVHICEQLEATKYITGSAAKAYMDEDMFEDKGIEVEYLDYGNYQEYHQLFPPFKHEVSILDLLFNQGEESTSFLKYRP